MFKNLKLKKINKKYLKLIFLYINAILKDLA